MASANFQIDKANSKIQYKGSFLTLETVSYIGSDRQSHLRDVVRHPGAVVVVPYLVESDTVLLIEQYRVATNLEMLELPAGKRDIEGEDPVSCAVRELEEELGVKASSMVSLVSFYNTPGFCDELTYVFLARGLTCGSRNPQGAEEAASKGRSLQLADLEELVSAGKIVDAKTIIGLYATRSYLRALAAPERFVDDIDPDLFDIVVLA